MESLQQALSMAWSREPTASPRVPRVSYSSVIAPTIDQLLLLLPATPGLRDSAQELGQLPAQEETPSEWNWGMLGAQEQGGGTGCQAELCGGT